jgi:hypothetical protein
MDRVYTEDELAEHLHVPPKTIEYWRYRRTGPKWFRAGRHVRYRESAVREWEKAREDEESARAGA